MPSCSTSIGYRSVIAVSDATVSLSRFMEHVFGRMLPSVPTSEVSHD
jgi:hypothetical protein